MRIALFLGSKGEMHIIPKGIEHKLYAVKKCHHHAGEPKGAVNTGETNGELTAENDVWV